MPSITHTISYNWYTFEQLTKEDLYDILKVRQQVFVVEQNCPYLDVDDLDQHSCHLLAYLNKNGETQLAGYLRIILPGRKYAEPAIGRLLTTGDVRGKGVGRELMDHAISYIEKEHPGNPIRISAQCYLTEFYTSLGFSMASEPYDEDGIQHVEMLRPIP